MIKKFIKKPVEIESVQFFDNAECLALLSEFTNQDLVINYEEPKFPLLGISTLEDKNGIISHWASEGDWIIKGVKGEFYPCKPDIFNLTYDLKN